MALIKISQKGDFKKTFTFFKKLRTKKFLKTIDKYGKIGVDALRDATPKRTGLTAESWGYEAHIEDGYATLVWTNTNENKGRYIAVLIQYGHGTRNGGYVRGIDYINPAMKPVFQEIADKLWAEVISDE